MVYTIITIGNTTIAINAIISSGIRKAVPSTSISVKTAMIGNVAPTVAEPATATAKRVITMMNAINSMGNANMAKITFNTMLSTRPQPVFCDLSTFTFGRRFSPNSVGAPICDWIVLTISMVTTCVFLANRAFWNSSAMRDSMSVITSLRSLVGRRISMSSR